MLPFFYCWRAPHQRILGSWRPLQLLLPLLLLHQLISEAETAHRSHRGDLSCPSPSLRVGRAEERATGQYGDELEDGRAQRSGHSSCEWRCWSGTRIITHVLGNVIRRASLHTLNWTCCCTRPGGAGVGTVKVDLLVFAGQ